MSYFEAIKFIKNQALIRYDNEDILVADKADWNRCIPAFQEISGALEMIELAINKGNIPDSKKIDHEDGVAIFANTATIHGLPENIETYLEAIKYLRATNTPV